MKPRLLFVTGKLAEPSLRRIVAEIATSAGFDYSIAVLPITVVALATTPWIARHLHVPEGVDRIILPGLCLGDLTELATLTSATIERGPVDLRDLPDHFRVKSTSQSDYGAYSIEILAEINHAPRLTRSEILAQARSLVADGADRIDLGCDPGDAWTEVGDCVRALRDRGIRVSIDSFNPTEVEAAARAGADLVLSVNSSNVERAADWGIEVVAIPDDPATLAGLDSTLEELSTRNVPFRVDPILEPIGFGFAASLGRYLDVRCRYPDVGMLMGIGNLTELTDVDSAGMNVLLLGVCEELGIHSILTTQVINWCRSCVREIDLARRLVHFAHRHKVLPKRLEPALVMLRDPRLRVHGDDALRELASQLTDRNFRLFAEEGKIHVLNAEMHLVGDDPFELFAEMEQRSDLSPSHAFYLGYEMAKAITALTLGKNYVQDQALSWGMLTREEKTHRGAKK